MSSTPQGLGEVGRRLEASRTRATLADRGSKHRIRQVLQENKSYLWGFLFVCFCFFHASDPLKVEVHVAVSHHGCWELRGNQVPMPRVVRSLNH